MKILFTWHFRWDDAPAEVSKLAIYENLTWRVLDADPGVEIDVTLPASPPKQGYWYLLIGLPVLIYGDHHLCLKPILEFQ